MVRLFDAMAMAIPMPTKDDVKRVRDFLSQDNVYGQLQATVSMLIPHRSDVSLKLNMGGGSYTDGDHIVVGVPNICLDLENEEIFIILRALTGHELQHVNSSNFKAYKAYREWVENYFLSKYPTFNKILLKNYSSKVGEAFGNGIEDGRIEKILGDNYKGFRKHIKFMNYTFWERQPMNGASELQDFLHSIVSISVTGMEPKDFEKHWAGSELESQLNVVKPYIYKGIHAKTCHECLEICKEGILAVEEYLVRLFEDRSAQDEEMIRNFEENFEFVTSEENTFNSGDEGSSVHFVPFEMPQPEEEDEENSQGGGSGSEGTDEDSKEEQDEQETQGGEGDSSEEQSDSDESSATSSSSKATDGPPSSQAESSKEKMEQLKEEMKGLRDELKEEAKTKLSEEADKKKGSKNDDSFELTPEDIESIKGSYEKDRVAIGFKEHKGFPLRHRLPGDIEREGYMFRKKVEKILTNKDGYTAKGQRSGVLDRTRMHELVAMKNPNVFIKRGVPIQSDFVFFLLEDGSGSMVSDNKQWHSKRALMVMEEGLKGVVPFKTTTYSVDWDEDRVGHYMIKDFDEERKDVNYAYNAYQHRKAYGGNKDGFSIRIATEELLKRPEKDRVLIVFSDGIPTDYTGGERQGMRDVKEAVREARRKGITVISIIFGDEYFRNRHMPQYREMYEKNIISCEPSMIMSQLLSLLTKIISR